MFSYEQNNKTKSVVTVDQRSVGFAWAWNPESERFTYTNTFSYTVGIYLHSFANNELEIFNKWVR